jgi:hypothetical protein
LDGHCTTRDDILLFGCKIACPHVPRSQELFSTSTIFGYNCQHVAWSIIALVSTTKNAEWFGADEFGYNFTS